jgi:hypothetical protein
MNFPDFTIDPGSITWDFALQDSDYSTIRQAKEQAGNYAAWQIESSLDLSPYQIENLVLAAPADQNYTAVDAPDGGGVLETADQVRTADMAALFGTKDQSQVRITRMRADLAHAALANDLALQAASDQSPLSNVYQVTDYVHAPTCPAVPPMSTCPPCPNLPYGYGGSATAGKTGDSFGCATAADGGTGGSGLEVLAIGAACAVILRIRSRGKKK